MKKKIILPIILFFCLVLPFFAYAQEDSIFKAEVIEIIQEETESSADSREITRQHLKLKGLEGDFEGKIAEFNGLGDIEVANQKIYQVGDKVIVAASYGGPAGEVQFYIVDYVRTGKIWWLVGLFLTVLILVGHMKGVRSVVALILTFIVITQYIIPQILNGNSPLLVTIIGSLVILAIIVYLTEGLNPRSHLSTISIFISLILTVLISLFFVKLTRLSGGGSEDVLFLFNLDGATINLQGLLLAGIIIGALGVLDDVVISQVATVEEISSANSELTFGNLFKKAYRVGTSHIASMTNTLFLAYAGVSLPLLILFVSGDSAFSSWTQALNTELIATEIVRTLSGSIGLVLSVPLATFISSWYYSKR